MYTYIKQALQAHAQRQDYGYSCALVTFCEPVLVSIITIHQLQPAANVLILSHYKSFATGTITMTLMYSILTCIFGSALHADEQCNFIILAIMIRYRVTLHANIHTLYRLMLAAIAIKIITISQQVS